MKVDSPFHTPAAQRGIDPPTIGEFLDKVRVLVETTSLSSVLTSPLREFDRAHGHKSVLTFSAFDVELTVEDFGREAERKGHSGAYAREHATYAQRFFWKRVRDDGHRWDNPAENAKTHPRPDSNRRRLLWSEQQELWHVVGATGLDRDLDLLICDALRETAGRIKFAYTATWTALDPQLSALTVYGKNYRNPKIPISQGLVDRLIRHHDERAPRQHDPTTPLFIRKDGAGVTSKKFETLFKRVHDYWPHSKQEGITAHWLRHTTLQEIDFVSDGEVAAAYAGHRPGRTIGTYARVYFPQLREAHDNVFDERGVPRREQQREFDNKMLGAANEAGSA